ncbi:uncharacterized protein TRAVEDRAFT_54555 [Trametes versicolor FP-101664 SS1]|uniref:Uncharacterized protein n=1 Tax=Trametes versicolor (strain FP-101664) TaxID=717944 RepID=R7S8Z1_TRAVS|nr:uncharacterized protein TRAVEDRAFT_54555 [Trametes versicolor FP-101664 SS1]EIW51439.1 hypothetical protein TRAVEDRAFT_54555 [Trametes versicolor FP-101664 SS1]
MDMMLAMRWHRLRTQDALDKVRGPLPLAGRCTARHTAGALALHLGRAKLQRRAPVHPCPKPAHTDSSGITSMPAPEVSSTQDVSPVLNRTPTHLSAVSHIRRLRPAQTSMASTLADTQ